MDTDITLTEPEHFAFAVLDSLSAHVAVLARNGLILYTNQAWKRFARTNDIRIRPDTLHVNYLEICQSAIGDSADEARDVYQGITDLIDRRIDEFVIDYPCHSPDRQRWFYMRATRLNLPGEVRILVSHEDITPLKRIEDKLTVQTERLKDTNTALRVLLDQRDKDRNDLEETLVSHLRALIFPYMDQLAQTALDDRQKKLLDIIRSHAENALSPLLSRFSALENQLTPMELKVAVLVKEGRSTKEIAGVLCVSADAVDFHRKNIRKKLGLTHRKTNLQSYLASLK
ncbi:MAG: LuxR C-terminal-related transcriptional regulator [Thermodesulfobacteriota bacterium]